MDKKEIYEKIETQKRLISYKKKAGHYYADNERKIEHLKILLR